MTEHRPELPDRPSRPAAAANQSRPHTTPTALVCRRRLSRTCRLLMLPSSPTLFVPVATSEHHASLKARHSHAHERHYTVRHRGLTTWSRSPRVPGCRAVAIRCRTPPLHPQRVGSHPLSSSSSLPTTRQQQDWQNALALWPAYDRRWHASRPRHVNGWLRQCAS